MIAIFHHKFLNLKNFCDPLKNLAFQILFLKILILRNLAGVRKQNFFNFLFTIAFLKNSNQSFSNCKIKRAFSQE